MIKINGSINIFFKPSWIDMYTKPRVFGNDGERGTCPWCKTKGWIGWNKNKTGWYLKKRCKCDKFPVEQKRLWWGHSSFTKPNQIRYDDINDYLLYTLQRDGISGVFNKQDFLQFFRNTVMARL